MGFEGLELLRALGLGLRVWGECLRESSWLLRRFFHEPLGLLGVSGLGLGVKGLGNKV